MPVGGHSVGSHSYEYGDDPYSYAYQKRVAGQHRPIAYTGRLPQRFAMTQEVDQWSPRLQRVFQIAPEGDGTGFDWQPPQEGFSGVDDLSASLIPAARKAFGAEAAVSAFHRGRAYDVENIHRLRATNLDGHIWSRRIPFSIAKSEGLFEYVSGISPHGGGKLEDLQLVDFQEMDHLLVLITVERHGDTYLYRKFFRLHKP